MYGNRILSIGLLSIVIGLSPGSRAADMPDPESIPEPTVAEKGIWGAIAYSTTDNRHGFFGERTSETRRRILPSNTAIMRMERTARSLRYSVIIVTGKTMTTAAFLMSTAPPCL
jgi:hypothetical protein